MKNVIFFACCCVFFLFAGCSSSRTVGKDGWPLNEARVVAVQSSAPVAKEAYGKTFWIEPASGWEKHEYSFETKTYLVRGLEHLGYKLSPVKAKADFIVVYSFKCEDRHRRDAYLNVMFTKNDKVSTRLWDGVSHCSFSKNRSYRPMLSGLAGGVLLYVGRSGGGRTKLSNYKAMMNAVEGQQ